MSTKVPIYLKRGSRKGKKEKLRDILSPAMISPPLGDFRHTSHVGPAGQGDAFGDISFLQGNFHLLPGAGGGPQGPPFEFCRAATISGPRQELCLGASSSSLEASSSSSCPLLKNAISLPIIGGPQALTLPSSQAPPKPPRLHLEEGRSLAPPPPPSSSSPLPPPSSSPPPPPPSPPPLSSPLPPPPPSSSSLLPPSSSSPPPPTNSLEDPDPAFLSHTSSLLSLHLDLGPSILEEVLQVMEKHQAGPGGSGGQEVLT